ncbi:MAG: hypothetical protein AB1815_01590 [Bacillota bacterium]
MKLPISTYCGTLFITELIRPKTPASVGGGFQRAVKSSMDSANIQRGLNPPLNEVSFNSWLITCSCTKDRREMTVCLVPGLRGLAKLIFSGQNAGV